MSRRRPTTSPDERLDEAFTEACEREREAVLPDCLRAVLATPQGRRVLMELTDGLLRTVYDTSGQQMAFNEGRRMHKLDWLRRAQSADSQAMILAEHEMRTIRTKTYREVEARYAPRPMTTERSTSDGDLE